MFDADKTRMIRLPYGEQELSYRKQIARKLRTQYVEGTHRPKYYTVTLKSRLRVTKVIETGAIQKLGCGFLFDFYSNNGRI